MTQRIEYKPRPYGPGAVNFMLRHQRCNLWAKPGMGKTVLCYTALDAMYLCSLESRPTLVLGPKRVARDVWPKEALKWDHLRDFTTSAIVGDEDERKAALRRDAIVYTMNYENLGWLLKELDGSWPFGTVIADESTRLKGFRLKQGGKRAHALSEPAWTRVNRWINLTGTPASNGVKDLWGQMWFIDRGARLGSSFSAFEKRWFYTTRDGHGLIPFPHAETEIKNAIRDVCLTIDPKDYYDIKDPIVTQINVQLPERARKIYDEFEDTMFAELQCGAELEVFNAAALTNKCLQIANGAVYHGGGWKPVHDAKLEVLESIAEEINDRILVAYAFRSDLERIQNTFGKRAADISTIAGMRAFTSGDAQLGVAHPASIGHGVDGLQDYCNNLVRFGRDWNLENQLQMLERIGPMRQLQAGFDRAVMVYDIVAEQTIDEQVIERHASKQSVLDLLMSAMKGVRLV